MFDNVDQFMAHLGLSCDTDDLDAASAALSRHVYKNTPYGGWARVFAPGRLRTGTESQRWLVRLQQGIGGVYIQHLTRPEDKAGAVRQGAAIFGPTVPQEVRDFFGLRAEPRGVASDYLIEGGRLSLDDILAMDRVHPIGTLGALMSVTLDVATYEPHEGGVLVGAIVEGSQAEAEPEPLYFPFNERDWEIALEEVGHRVDAILEPDRG